MAIVGIYGYRRGLRETRKARVANTAVSGGIKKGDFLKWDGVAGYVTQAAAGDLPCAVANEACVTIPTTDGGQEIEADFGPQSIFEYPPDTGTVTVGMIGKTMDVGGAQSINIDASADDGVECVDVDTTNNTVFCKIKFAQAETGIA